jgi:hypothetical protein
LGPVAQRKIYIIGRASVQVDYCFLVIIPNGYLAATPEDLGRVKKRCFGPLIAFAEKV